jgi:hypothetical protein
MDGEHIYLPQISISKNRMKQNDQNMSELESKSFWDKLHERNTCTKMNLVISFSILDRSVATGVNRSFCGPTLFFKIKDLQPDCKRPVHK